MQLLQANMGSKQGSSIRKETQTSSRYSNCRSFTGHEARGLRIPTFSRPKKEEDVLGLVNKVQLFQIVVKKANKTAESRKEGAVFQMPSQ